VYSGSLLAIRALLGLLGGDSGELVATLVSNELSVGRRKLFLADETNYFKEPVLLKQLTGWCLRALLKTSPVSAEVDQALRENIPAVISALTQLFQALQTPGLSSSFTTRKEPFEKIYSIFVRADVLLRAGLQRGLLTEQQKKEIAIVVSGFDSAQLHPLLYHVLCSRRDSLHTLFCDYSVLPLERRIPEDFSEDFLCLSRL